MSSENFPLLVLQPMLGPAQEWTAVRVRGGKLGELLDLVEKAEMDADADVIAAALRRAGIGNEAWCRAQVEALRWTWQISRNNQA